MERKVGNIVSCTLESVSLGQYLSMIGGSALIMPKDFLRKT